MIDMRPTDPSQRLGCKASRSLAAFLSRLTAVCAAASALLLAWAMAFALVGIAAGVLTLLRLL